MQAKGGRICKKVFTPPKSSASKVIKEDWRTPMQTEAMRKITGWIGLALNILGVICFLGTSFLGRLSILWSSACLLVISIAFGLYLAYPQYYFLFGNKLYKYIGYAAKVKHLDCATDLPMLALFLRCLRDFYFPNWVTVLIVCITAVVIFSVVIYLFSRDFRKDSNIMVITVFLAILFSFGIVGQLNHILNLDAEAPKACTVIDTEKSGNTRRSRRYSCTVSCPDGTEMKLPISSSGYRQLRSGDVVVVYSGKGALGIEYAYLEEKG